MFTKSLCCLVLVMIMNFYVHGQGPECRPGYCDTVKCASRENCQKPNQYIQQTPCGCCPVCFTLLEEGESCPPILLGGPPPTSACNDGLQCIDGICRATNNN